LVARVLRILLSEEEKGEEKDEKHRRSCTNRHPHLVRERNRKMLPIRSRSLKRSRKKPRLTDPSRGRR
jgi:hypothetical protein